MSDLMIADHAMLDDLVAQARHSPRRRKNLNFHASNEARCHRLLNAVEPDAYIPPHRHLGEEKDETMAVIRGRMGFILFDDAGRVVRRIVLGPGQSAAVVNIPRGAYHTSLSLESGTVFLEAKAGPYAPLTPEERASWAPSEGTEQAPAYLAEMKALFASL